MWAQEWDALWDILAPFPELPLDDVTDAMRAQGYSQTRMAEMAEDFFTSIGLEPMTETFWEKSMLTRPESTPVQCHASAEDFHTGNDFR